MVANQKLAQYFQRPKEIARKTLAGVAVFAMLTSPFSAKSVMAENIDSGKVKTQNETAVIQKNKGNGSAYEIYVAAKTKADSLEKEKSKIVHSKDSIEKMLEATKNEAENARVKVLDETDGIPRSFHNFEVWVLRMIALLGGVIILSRKFKNKKDQKQQ